jgi:hypothetical protein
MSLLTEHRADLPWTHQCAWCRRIANEHGAYVQPAAELLTGNRVTHCLCRPCREGMAAALEAWLQRKRASQ